MSVVLLDPRNKQATSHTSLAHVFSDEDLVLHKEYVKVSSQLVRYAPDYAVDQRLKACTKEFVIAGTPVTLYGVHNNAQLYPEEDFLLLHEDGLLHLFGPCYLVTSSPNDVYDHSRIDNLVNYVKTGVRWFKPTSQDGLFCSHSMYCGPDEAGALVKVWPVRTGRVPPKGANTMRIPARDLGFINQSIIRLIELHENSLHQVRVSMMLIDRVTSAVAQKLAVPTDHITVVPHMVDTPM